MSNAGSARPIVFGEVLFDCFEDGPEVLGGAPFNVAWNLRGLGLEPLFVSRVGDDDAGRRILAAMDRWNLDPEGVQVDPLHPTGRVEVKTRAGEPSFEILEDRAWDYIAAPSSLPPAGVLYHGSLALRGEVSRAGFTRIRKQVDAPVFLDVNLRPPWWEASLVERILEEAAVVKLNEDELVAIRPSRGQAGLDEARSLQGEYGISTLILTRGARGAVVLDSHGEEYAAGEREPAEVVDTVGAGDAFSSVMILGQLAGWPLATGLDRAHDFAAAVVGLRGATTVDPTFYDTFRRTWNLA
jgi:fructokinase